MVMVGSLLVVAFAQVAPTPEATASLDIFFTDDAVIEKGVTAAAAEWTARCVAGGQFAEVAGSYAPDPGVGMTERKAQMAKFDRQVFVRLATEAWQRANEALPQPSLRLCVDVAAPGDAFTRDVMGGVAGVTAGGGRIVLRIHPDAPWQAAVPYAVAHELHHSYWVHAHFNPAAPFTLADYLMLEGRADYFARALFPRDAPWTAPLDAAAYAAVWQRVSSQLGTTEWNVLQATMFGAPDAGVPQWAGYRLGYRLVSERMARGPALDLRAMSAAPASEFLPPATVK
jgi:uncharacterized protein YjaZ